MSTGTTIPSKQTACNVKKECDDIKEEQTSNRSEVPKANKKLVVKPLAQRVEPELLIHLDAHSCQIIILSHRTPMLGTHKPNSYQFIDARIC